MERTLKRIRRIGGLEGMGWGGQKGRQDSVMSACGINVNFGNDS